MRNLLKAFFLLLALVFVASGTPFYTDTINLDLDLRQDAVESTDVVSLEYSLIENNNTAYAVELRINAVPGLFELEILTSAHFSADLMMNGEVIRQLVFENDLWLATVQENDPESVTYSNLINLAQDTLNLPDGTYELHISAADPQLAALAPLTVSIGFSSLTEYLPASSQPPAPNSLGLRLHFPDASFRYLIPITRFVPQTSTTLRETVIQLEAGPSPSLGLFDRSPIPPVPRIQLSSGTASLYLSSQLGFYNEYPRVAQMAAASLVESLGSIWEVSRIQFYFNNRIVDEGFVSVSTGSVIEPAKPPFFYPVFRSPSGRGFLVPLPLQNPSATVEDLVAALTFKHNASLYGAELQPTLSPEVELLDYALEGTTLMVNFNQAFAQRFVDHPLQGRIMVDSLLLSLTSLNGVESVLFRVNGQVPSMSVEQTFDLPLARPAYVNPEMP